MKDGVGKKIVVAQISRWVTHDGRGTKEEEKTKNNTYKAAQKR